jgi:thiol-disulfide isomerase/thioredoxin
MKSFFLVFPLVFGLCSTALADGADEVPVNGYLKEATLYKMDGVGTKKLSEYRGKPLIINIWASWCGPCRQEMASLNRLAKRFNGKQFNVIGVSTDDDTGAAAAYAKQSKLVFPVYLDSRDFFMEGMLGAHNIPLTILVSADGKVLDKVPGAQEWDRPEVIKAIGETFGIRLP